MGKNWGQRFTKVEWRINYETEIRWSILIKLHLASINELKKVHACYPEYIIGPYYDALEWFGVLTLSMGTENWAKFRSGSRIYISQPLLTTLYYAGYIVRIWKLCSKSNCRVQESARTCFTITQFQWYFKLEWYNEFKLTVSHDVCAKAIGPHEKKICFRYRNDIR